MLNKDKLKGFLVGVCSAALLAGAVTAFATTIDVTMAGVKVYWDGVEKTLLDADHNKVEPIIYEGTTYVPLRAMSNLMGKTVDWDQSTLSVYVGVKPVGATTPLDKLDQSKINRAGVYMETGKDAYFQLKDETIQCSNLLLNSADGYYWQYYNIYVLNGNYSRLVGKAVMPYTSVGSSKENELIFYSVENDGTENEIKRYELKQTQDPVDVDVNLTGVTNLKIKWRDEDIRHDSVGRIALYDVNLLGK